MKKIISVLLTVCLLVGCCTLCLPVFAAKKAANAKTLVVIEADSAGTLGGNAQPNVVAAQRDLLQQVEDTADVSVLYTYTSVLNGVAAQVRQGEDMPAVAQVEFSYDEAGVEAAIAGDGNGSCGGRYFLRADDRIGNGARNGL